MQSNVWFLRSRRHSAAVAAVTVSTSCEPSSLPHRVALNRIVFDDKNPAHALRQPRLELLQNFSQILVFHRFQLVADRAEREGGLRVVGRRNHVDRDMARARIALQLIKHPKAGMIRQPHIQHDGARNELRGKREPLGRAACDQALELHFVRKVLQDASETVIVFDNQEDAPLTTKALPVVLDLPLGPRGRRGRWRWLRRMNGRWGNRKPRRFHSRLRWRGAVAFGNDDRERAALTLHAAKRERSVKQTDKLPTDR